MSAILCISFYLTFKQLYGLHVELITAEVGQVGQVLTLKLNFKQPTKTNRYLQIQWQQQQQLFYLNQTQQSIELAFFPQQRGIYQFDAIKIYSTYPLGLVRAWTYLNLMEKVWIAPKAYEWQKNIKISRVLRMIV